MRAVFARNSLQFRAVELRRIKLPLARIIFVTGEVNDSGGFINAVDPKHLKISLRELALELGVPFKQPLFVEAVEIKMRVPIAPTWPYETVSGFENQPAIRDAKIIHQVNPGIGCAFRQHLA